MQVRLLWYICDEDSYFQCSCIRTQHVAVQLSNFKLNDSLLTMSNFDLKWQLVVLHGSLVTKKLYVFLTRKYSGFTLLEQRTIFRQGEPYFAMFYDNNFQRVEANFSNFFYLLSKNVFGFDWHKRNNVKVPKVVMVLKSSGSDFGWYFKSAKTCTYQVFIF